MKRKQIKRHHIIQVILLLLIVAVLNIIASLWNFRIDLTEDNRYSLSDTSKELLKNIDDVVFIKVYLDGNELPANFLRLQRETRQMLNNFRRVAPEVEYEFINLQKEKDKETRQEIYQQLYDKGLNPTQVSEGGMESTRQQFLFPGAIVTYKGAEYPVNLLENDGASNTEYKISKAISRLEQNFIQALLRLKNPETKKIAFIEGHGELDQYQTMDVMVSLSEFYTIERLSIDGVLGALDEYEAIVVAKPTERVSEKDKFIIDQYIMHGGKALWLVEWMGMSMDSLSNKPSSMALIRDINMDDILFNYGVRINPDLIQDYNCFRIPITVNQRSGKPQFEPRPWYFFPAVIPPKDDHIITKNVSLIRSQFVSSIDTVGENDDINKTYLLHTSEKSRTLGVPVRVSLEMVSQPPSMRLFDDGPQPIAVLLEGKFRSNFDMRIPGEFVTNEAIDFKAYSQPTKQIVVSDGDIIRNYVRKMGDRKAPEPLGKDKYYDQQFAPGNKEFILNAINYLCGDNELINLRMKQIKLRMLDQAKVYERGIFWVVFNTAVPIIIVLLFGFVLIFIRRRIYTRY